jgi:hypothetical protein
VVGLNRKRWTILVVVVGWLITMFLVTIGLQTARRWALAELGTASAKADWQQYRQAVAEEGRRTPKSDEPPTLILLRDRFAGVLASTLVLATSLYAFLALVLVGMWRGSASQPASNLSTDRDPTVGRFVRKQR